MKTYTYRFCDGTASTVEVGDEWYAILAGMDKREKNNNRRHTRRHVSLDYLNTFDLDIEAPDGDPLDGLIRREKEAELNEASTELKPQQRELIKKVFVRGEKKIDIAAADGVSPAAVSDRLTKIYMRLKKLLG